MKIEVMQQYYHNRKFGTVDVRIGAGSWADADTLTEVEAYEVDDLDWRYLRRLHALHSEDFRPKFDFELVTFDADILRRFLEGDYNAD